MAKVQSIYVCQQCGAESLRWQGQCSSCQSWNTLVEVAKPSRKGKGSGRTNGAILQSEIIPLHQIKSETKDRCSTGFEELDRVLGGGLLDGSVTLLGGEPGVGKSTLLLQVALNIGGLYVTAEESGHQVKLRADRLTESKHQNLSLMASNDIDQAIAAIESQKPACAIIDSIQTVSTADLDGVPGSVGQVRESANRLVQTAKRLNIPIIIVSHVTKEGTIAGPKVLEHVVDTVLYVEGESLSTTRIVRGIKKSLRTIT